MKASRLRARFLGYFEDRGHVVRPSSPLVPSGDDSLLFANAGMVQFKEIFLGLEDAPFPRAATSQKCVRAGGKHNDLAEVGRTARHHTFFEMLGNFSFGDYFKSEAICYAWDFLTRELGISPDDLYVTVHHTDDEAALLWEREAGVDPGRIFRLGDRDNFWRMGDTGPCGPCSEIHFDGRSKSRRGGTLNAAEFEACAESGAFLELWNLVFMQFDRASDGTLRPLPAPSIDTGAGLERLASVLQGVSSNYDTDLFAPLLAAAAQALGKRYRRDEGAGVAHRVLADHSRAAVFLVCDGVFPTNEGRGYVLRRILRRAVRHAWRLGCREPTVCKVADAVFEAMGEAYQDIILQRSHITSVIHNEEERFLRTIDGGMKRLEELTAHARRIPASSAVEAGVSEISGSDAFKLYDTFGFPPDLTEIIAAERGFAVDMAGFELELERQRARSRADRKATGEAMDRPRRRNGTPLSHPQRSRVYEQLSLETAVAASLRGEDGRVCLILEDNPFYAEGGGQVSDAGLISGKGDRWRMEAEEVQSDPGKFLGCVGVWGAPEGRTPKEFAGEAVRASVDLRLRAGAERNHTATHLLHAGLRDILGSHVAQRGSKVEPGRLRFDFVHPKPMSTEEVSEVERWVNRRIWDGIDVEASELPLDDALAMGATALFGEKYGDVVRMVRIGEESAELCGGTHARNTALIGLFVIRAEAGVAAGVRRVEAVTAERAFAELSDYRARIRRIAASLRAQPPQLEGRLARMKEREKELSEAVRELRRSPGSSERVVARVNFSVDGAQGAYRGVRLACRAPAEAREWGDAFRSEHPMGAAALAAELPGGKAALFAFAGDAAIGAGLRADALLREVAKAAGGRGGGRPHMAQGSAPDATLVDDALKRGASFVEAFFAKGEAK